MGMPDNQPINMSINMSCPSATTTPHTHHDELLPAQSVEQPRVYTSPCWPLSPTTWKHRWPRSGYQTRASTWCVNIYYACQAHTLAIKRINIMYEAIYIMYVTTSILCMYEYEYVLCIQLYAKHKYACNQTRASTWCANIYYVCQAYACKHINIINLWLYLLCQTHMFATNRINIMYEAIYIMPSTYICNQMHQHYVWIYIMSHTYAYKHINIIYVWRYIMHAKHIRLQSNASIWCVHILCMPSTYACKRIDMMCE